MTDKYPPPENLTATPRGVRPKPSERLATISALAVRHSFFMPQKMRNMTTLLWWAKAKFPERGFVARTREEEGVVGVRIWRLW